MKLKTELVNHFPLMCDFDALKHDAAAAHALMQALKESSNMWFSTQQNVLSWIEERADELMREWGFES